jgi:hypothetical protein
VSLARDADCLWMHVDSGSELAGFYRGAGFTDAEWAGIQWFK